MSLPPTPPVARTVPVTTTLHGETRVDPYAWLREKDAPEVRAYLEAENAYTEAVLAPLASLREQLYAEMLSHIKQTDLSVPYPDRGYWYYSRTEEGMQYPFFCRRKGTMDAPEEVILDLNALAEGQPFLAVGAAAVSDDGRWLAYSTDTTGFRQYTLQIKDLERDEILPWRAERVGSVAWANDNTTLFYTVEDEQTKRQHRLLRHTRGATGEDLVFEEPDELFHISVARTRNRRLLVLTISSHTTSECRIADAAAPGEWRTVEPRRHEHEYYVDARDDEVLVRTNDRGRNFRLMRAPLATPGSAHWREVIPHREDVMLEDADAFAAHIVVTERAGGLPRLRVLDAASGEAHAIAFPEPAYSLGPEQNAEYDTTRFRYAYQSFVTPQSVFEYDLVTREQVLLKQTEVPGYEAARYRSERLHATAADGTHIPISLVYRLGEGDEAPQRPGPLLLNGYGSYGYPLPVTFSAARLALLDRGVAFAIAHIRGGGELGKPWHDAGRMARKMNTFTDFIAAAEHLIAAGWTTPAQLAITGGSAGGLLMGAVVNLRPELFRAVVSHVPFVDVLNTMLDASLPLTVGEYEEWGNPNLPGEYAWIRAYCPYTNLRAGTYPAMLVRTALNDSQVMYWEPAKYVARLRTLQQGEAPILLETNMGAGHGGASGRYDYLKEIALDYAFLLWQLGRAVRTAGDTGTIRR